MLLWLYFFNPPGPVAGPAVLLPLVAVDGCLLPALPRMAWALWQDDSHRAAKLHLAFSVFKTHPIAATVTAGPWNYSSAG